MQIGDLVDGKYRIERILGSGGLSRVYLARNERANKTWAIKEMRISGRAGIEVMHTELKALRDLHHPNLPEVVDVIDAEDSILLVMDYIEGKNLGQYLAEHGPASPAQVIRWGEELCGVLTYLHGRTPPIIYRDMKPGNVMLRPDGSVVLIDFGAVTSLADRSRIPGYGTFRYAAPEQLAGGKIDTRTDIYGLGRTLECLLGEVSGKKRKEPPEMRSLRAVLARSVREEPDERYPSAEDFRRALHMASVLEKKRRRKRRFRMAGFFLSLCMCAGGCIGMYAIRAGEKNRALAEYRYDLNLASQQKDLTASEEYLRKAMNLLPEETEAYELLLEMSEDRILADGQLSETSITLLLNCMNDSSGGSENHWDSLRRSAPELYDRMLYRLGIWYFFLNGDSSETRKQAADRYLSQITESAYLSDPEKNLAACLAEIGGYLGSLDAENRVYISSEDSEPADYLDLWEDMEDMVTSAEEKTLPEKTYEIYLYRQAADWVASRGEAFAEAGVTRSEMEKLAERLEEDLDDMESAGGLSGTSESMLSQARTTLDLAEQMIPAYYGREE